MNKESLSNTENNNGNDGWVESMSEVESSSEIDFEKRKQEIEALKLDIEKAKLEAEKREQKKMPWRLLLSGIQKERKNIGRIELLIAA